MNKVILVGKVDKEPQFATTKTGKQVVNFNIETTTNYNGEDHATHHKVTCWGALADAAREFARPRAALMVEGKIQYQKYVDKTGATRYVTSIVADSVIPLSVQAEKPTAPPAAGASGGPDYEESEDDLPW